MKIKIKFNGDLLKKDVKQHGKNLSNNKPFMNQEQLRAFILTVWYVFIPFFAGKLSVSIHWTLGFLMLIPLLFRLEIKLKKEKK